MVKYLKVNKYYFCLNNNINGWFHIMYVFGIFIIRSNCQLFRFHFNILYSQVVYTNNVYVKCENKD